MSQNVGPLDAATDTWMSDADPFVVGDAVAPLVDPGSLAWDDDDEDCDDNEEDDDEDWDDEDWDDEEDDEEDEVADLGDDDWDAMFDGGPREPLHRRRRFRDEE